MSRDRYDLHVHSTASDGLMAPREVVALAAERGLAGIALTDHDTVDGLAEAQGMATALGITCIAGVELSCTTTTHEQVHLLGYFFDPRDEGMAALFAEMREQRVARAGAIVQKVAELAGQQLTMDHVLAESDGAPPGRPHIARAMQRMGIVDAADEAFSETWFGSGGRAWVERAGTPLAAGVAAIHGAGGAAVLAHPAARSGGRVREEAIREGAGLGIDGLEVDHPGHDGDSVERCAGIAVELGLVQTAGSDDHGTGIDGSRLGCRTVPAGVVAALHARAISHRSG